MEFFIGQRVIYSNREIVTIIDVPEGKYQGHWSQWVRKANNFEQCVSLNNLRPLPNGQM